MKKFLIIVLAVMTLFALMGCEKLPEEPEPTPTPSSSTSETRDYYSDSEETTQDMEQDGEAPEGDDVEASGEEPETSDESEEDEEDSTFSYTRRSREEIEAELNEGVVKDDTEAKSIRGLTGSWRMIPPAGGWAFARGGVVRKEEPAATAEPAGPTPRPTPKPTPVTIFVKSTNILGEIDNNGVIMVPLDIVMKVLGGKITKGGTIRTVFFNGNSVSLDLSTGIFKHRGIQYQLDAYPYQNSEGLFVSIDFFEPFDDIVLGYDGNVKINATPTSYGD